LDKLPEKTHGMRLPTGDSTMTLEDQREIFKRIEDAFGSAANISSDVSKIAEALSFQDLSGQQIMKIIKLLSDFQIQLIALVVSFGSQLKHKEMNKDITVEECKKLAQEDVDSYINKLSGTSEEGGTLDQSTVNKMLEEMGF
ncbi:MAG: protein phosphatase CheZ, partial [Desulfobulbaceae bacterium]|nr:protein phosphatase CheZ [Desulfobulbaceae bacterium]